MILADTSVWIDHLRKADAEMNERLTGGQIVMHPFVIAEIALGSLRNRSQVIEEMESLLPVTVAQLSDVRLMIEAHAFYGKGIGLTDAHLLASCLLTPGTRLWTRDNAMRRVGSELGILAELS